MDEPTSPGGGPPRATNPYLDPTRCPGCGDTGAKLIVDSPRGYLDGTCPGCGRWRLSTRFLNAGAVTVERVGGPDYLWESVQAIRAREAADRAMFAGQGGSRFDPHRCPRCGPVREPYLTATAPGGADIAVCHGCRRWRLVPNEANCGGGDAELVVEIEGRESTPFEWVPVRPEDLDERCGGVGEPGPDEGERAADGGAAAGRQQAADECVVAGGVVQPPVGTLPPAPSPSPVWENRCSGRLQCAPNFATVKRGGEEFTFTATQRAVVAHLVRAREAGLSSCTQTELLDAAESDSAALRNVFRAAGETHPAWGRLIVSRPPKGSYGLDLGSETP